MVTSSSLHQEDEHKERKGVESHKHKAMGFSSGKENFRDFQRLSIQLR